MKAFVPEALLLLLLANLTLTWHPKGSHSLHFLKTVLTGPDILEPQFICDVYLDDIHVERFNSRAETPRLEQCAPWVGQQKPEYWELETQVILRLMDLCKEVLKKVILILNQSETGHHSIQIHTTCDAVVHGKNISSGSVTSFFNDQDFIVLTSKQTWLTLSKAAEILKQELRGSDFAETVKTFLNGECVQLLFTHLNYGKEIFLKTDTPKTYVTHKVRADGDVTLRCWAMNFYPAEISLTWQRDGSNQTLDVEVMDTRPAGDGTFQKWSAVVVPSGEGSRYTCYVNHEGLPEPITLRWEPPQPSVPIMAIVTSLVLGAVLTGAVVTFLIWKRRTMALISDTQRTWCGTRRRQKIKPWE